MHLGVVFPQTEIGADRAGVRDHAQAVQDLGFEHLLVYDHVLGADPAAYPDWSGPYTCHSMFHEPMVLFGYLAAIAPRLELVTAVIILPQRQTALAAKQAAEVDVLTGGKFRMGIGIGWNWVEYEGLGTNFRDRGRRYEEQIDLLRRLWTEPVVNYEGRYHKITAAGLNPLPLQRPIPLWIGASAEQGIKRAAELADGFFPQRPLEGGWDATMDRFRGWLEAAGRDAGSYGIERRIDVATGTPDDWQRSAEEWRTLGATHLSFNTMGGQLGGVEAHIARLRQVKETIGALRPSM